MKYSIHNTQEEADSALQSLDSHFNLPNNKATSYSTIEEVDGVFRFRVKDHGEWKADDIASNVSEVEVSAELPE
jgi:hypothetical protein